MVIWLVLGDQQEPFLAGLITSSGLAKVGSLAIILLRTILQLVFLLRLQVVPVELVKQLQWK